MKINFFLYRINRTLLLQRIKLNTRHIKNAQIENNVIFQRKNAMMKFLSLLLILVTLNSCVVNKIGKRTGIDDISFGSGGGFTGEVKTYRLSADCKLFEGESEISKIEFRKTSTIFKHAKDLKDLKFYEPENMYSFIEIKSKESTNRIVWAYGSTSVDKKVIELYNELLTTIK